MEFSSSEHPTWEIPLLCIRGTRISHTKWDSRTGACTRSSVWTAGFREIQILPFQNYPVRTFKRFVESRIARMTGFVLTKLFQFQGFAAPRVLTPLLMGAARKKT